MSTAQHYAVIHLIGGMVRCVRMKRKHESFLSHKFQAAWSKHPYSKSHINSSNNTAQYATLCLSRVNIK